MVRLRSSVHCISCVKSFFSTDKRTTPGSKGSNKRGTYVLVCSCCLVSPLYLQYLIHTNDLSTEAFLFGLYFQMEVLMRHNENLKVVEEEHEQLKIAFAEQSQR